MLSPASPPVVGGKSGIEGCFAIGYLCFCLIHSEPPCLIRTEYAIDSIAYSSRLLNRFFDIFRSIQPFFRCVHDGRFQHRLKRRLYADFVVVEVVDCDFFRVQTLRHSFPSFAAVFASVIRYSGSIPKKKTPHFVCAWQHHSVAGHRSN